MSPKNPDANAPNPLQAENPADGEECAPTLPVDATAPAAQRSEVPGSADVRNAPASPETTRQTEIGGQKGPEPTRYGDWEKNGRCTDF